MFGVTVTLELIMEKFEFLEDGFICSLDLMIPVPAIPHSICNLFDLYRRFYWDTCISNSLIKKEIIQSTWNQILICVGVKVRLFASVSRSGADKYFCNLNLLSSSTTCDCENRIRGFLLALGFPVFPQDDDEEVTMWTLLESSVLKDNKL